MEFASFKQRYVIGMEVETDEETGEPVDQNVKQYGVDRLLTFGGTKDEVAVGQFDSTDLEQFLKVQDKFRAECARISGTPLHYFLISTGDFPSGEAIKSAEGRFVGKIEDRQEDWGPIWSDAMLFGMRMEQSIDEEMELEILWKDASPRSDSELADTAVKKKTLGVSRYQTLKELGYDDEEIQTMLEEADALAQAQAVLTAIGKGPDVGAPAGEAGANGTGAGGGTPTAVAAAREAASQGRRSGPRS
jgi:Phage portal protein, SPP1 Gp6-like